MHLFLWAEDSQAELRSELTCSLSSPESGMGRDSFLEAKFNIIPGQRLPYLAFSRQFVPNARPISARSIRSWALEIENAVAGVLPDDQPWLLHVEPHYGLRLGHRIGARAWHTLTRRKRDGSPCKPGREARVPDPECCPDSEAGRHRCALLREAVIDSLRKRRRHLLRQLRAAPEAFTPTHGLVQVLLTNPEAGFISIAPAPLSFEQRHLISPFPKGELPIAIDRSAPSRAFAKLVEAELRLGQTIQSRQACVDLGASPGSWTYVAVRRGASVIAIDRAPLREDLMVDHRVTFKRVDVFEFRPLHPADWLLCDVIAPPVQTTELLLGWISRRWCRNFIVTLKMTGASGLSSLERLKRELPPLTSELFLSRLCANKKEICAFGSIA